MTDDEPPDDGTLSERWLTGWAAERQAAAAVVANSLHVPPKYGARLIPEGHTACPCGGTVHTEDGQTLWHYRAPGVHGVCDGSAPPPKDTP